MMTETIAVDINRAKTPSTRPESTYQRMRFFTPQEVAMHNASDDLWLSWLGKVYNLTPLVSLLKDDPLLTPILKNAGKDISNWFDPKTKDLKTQINPATGLESPYTPEGRFLHVPPPFPRADWSMDQYEVPWWKDHHYEIGRLSVKTRKIRVINTLTSEEHVLEVCCEETMKEIQNRYTGYNTHAEGYVWKRLGKLLNMDGTLDENSILDETSIYDKYGMDDEEFYPAIHLYFSDDLTIA